MRNIRGRRNKFWTQRDKPPPAKLSTTDAEAGGEIVLPIKEEEEAHPGNTELEAATTAITISPYEDTMTSLTNAESDRTDRMTDDDDDEPSSGSETYEEGDLLASAMDDDVTAQLAAAGWQIKHVNGDFHFFAFSNTLETHPILQTLIFFCLLFFLVYIVIIYIIGSRERRVYFNVTRM